MNLHRLTTHNLPSIRIHDQQSHRQQQQQHHHHHHHHHHHPTSHSSLLSQSFSSASSSHPHPMDTSRSMPREIPIPRHASPTSSRCGSYHGSLASATVVPPFLSLEPPGPSLPPPSNYHAFRQPDSFSSNGGDDSYSEGLRPRKVVLHIGRDRGGRDVGMKLSPIGKPSLIDDQELSGSRDGFSMRSEDSVEKNWRESFYKKSDVSPKELQSEESLRQQLQSSARSYDNSLLQKLNNSSTADRHRLTPPHDFRSFANTTGGGSLPPLPPQWQPHRAGSPRHLPSSSAAASPRTADSPFERWAHSSTGGEPAHPRSNHLSALSSSLTDFRSNVDNASLSSSQVTDSEMTESRMRRSASASLLGPGYDSYEDEDLQMEDTAPASHVSQMRSLTLHDARTPPHHYSQRVGSKRRASSPPNEDRLAGNSEPTRKGLLLEGMGSDMYNSSRRTPPIHHPVRSSPAGGHNHHHHQKFYHPRSASNSFTSASASSGTTHWSSSIGGQFSAASSLSTADWSPSASYNPSEEMMKDAKFRQVSISSGRPGTAPAGRRLPDISSAGKDSKDLPTILKHSPAPKMTGLFICECCPKKPKKFDSPSDLQLHELEKQYSCQYCNNRFKNKNEAERHQNSLHLRKHSWSCASLAGNFEAAFHQSPHRPNYADLCGYCGKDFPVPAQWQVRIDHLTTEHKFGECNQSKKFYRADHFRQHLKHSHSGTSGKWTNVLENACMRDEIPPTPINRGSTSSSCGGNGRTPSVISEEASE